jgi:hypothetical protein
LVSFRWIENEAVAFAGVSPLTAWSERQDRALRRDYDQVHAALRAWSSKPENLPNHIAIVEGKPYVMKEDEARGHIGDVCKCQLWTGDLNNYHLRPGQRERIEKWRAIQSKPLGENELERLDGTRESIKAVYVTDGGTPCVCDNYPWVSNTNLAKSFVPGSIDRAKRIFARLYTFRDDEGVDATTGKLRTMAINEARHPETGEILKLCVMSSMGERSFGVSDPWCAVWEGSKYYGPSPFLARCIAYRDHVLKLEKELEELK